MSNSSEQPISYSSEERAPHLTPAYCYIVQNEDGTSMFLTRWDQPVIITNVPFETGASTPQTFQPSQIKHGAIQSQDRYEYASTTITVTAENTALQRFFLTAAAVKLKAWIIRVIKQDITGTLDFETDCIIVQSGILGKVGFKGNEIGVELTPEPFYVEGKIPRIYFGRQCQHPLYGERVDGVGCGVDKTLFNYTAEILTLDPTQRVITIEGQRPDSAETFFNAGHLDNLTAGGKMTIAWSAFNGSDTDLKMVTWNPSLEVGQTLRAYAGCRHIVEACREFANEASFGGFPDVPNKTPLAGVA